MNSLEEIWKAVLARVSKDITETAFNTWFDDCEPVELANDQLVVHTTSYFKRDVLVTRFAPTISQSLSDLLSCEVKVLILAEDEYEAYMASKSEADEFFPEMEGYTFDRFVVGPSNKYAHAAAIAVANNPGGAYNPLFIYGNSGLGKTHLLMAIGQAIHEKWPDKTIAYIKGDEFTNQMVRSIQTGSPEEFRQKYRNVDLFLMDDIQFIAGKQQTQEEFFHTFNTIYEAGHQIVLTSDRPPMEMKTLDDRLRTRFEGGLIADVQPPDLETRIAIIRNKAAQLGLSISEDGVNYIAENLTSNIRQIEGIVKRLTAYHDLLGEPIGTEAIRRAIKDVIRIGIYIPTPDVIVEETARYYSLSPEELRGQSRTKNTAMARQISMYLIRQFNNLPLKDIGKLYSDRNHTTVLASIKKVEELVKTDEETASIVRDISSNINARSDY